MVVGEDNMKFGRISWNLCLLLFLILMIRVIGRGRWYLSRVFGLVFGGVKGDLELLEEF